MTLLHPKVDPTNVNEPDAEALIREARRLRRRRWLVGSSVVLVAVLLGGGFYLASDHAPKKPVNALTASKAKIGQPYVNIKAFSHAGELAFVSQDRLWVLDGPKRSLRELPVGRGYVASSPTISRDGKWLAYVATYSTTDQGVTKTAVWIARANGTDAHEVPGLTNGGFFGWSPTADELAVTNTTAVRYPSGFSGRQSTVLELVTPSGAMRQLVALQPTTRNPIQIENAVWSPDGRDIAISITAPAIGGGSTIRAYPVSGGAPTTWFSISNKAVLPGICTGCGGGQTIAQLAGWWPKWGIGFWAFSSGMTHNNDDTPIELLTTPGATPHIIGQTLSDGTTVTIASGSNGALAIVGSTGGREYAQGKVVEICDRGSLTCSPISDGSVWRGKPLPCPSAGCAQQPAAGAPGSGVTLDPAWSPNDRLLAYVNAPVVPDDVSPLVPWYSAHELVLLDTATHATTNVAALHGASVPTWSRDGKDLLYVDNDTLWMWPVSEGHPVEIAGPLFSEQAWHGANALAGGQYLSYYDQVDWIGQFSWWSP